ncbi:hypothetical protein M5K25_001967 [Dendrobium thyrsiflorum]|uniref:Homeobox domain-containing protein n=1 Tax=Dendrobium thyrsiflorum TaxID=117978 RepID=A0ABD0VRD6_DENTH
MSPNKCDEIFHWQRFDAVTLDEPSEATIWEAIDRHDPRGDADIHDRVEQHEDMLRDSVAFDNPGEWVTNIRLQCGEFNLVDSTVDQISWAMCDILQPAADTVEPVGQSRLLSHRQLHLTTLKWPCDSLVGQVQSPITGYVCWGRYILRAHKHTLQEASIYEAVYASLFDFGRIPSSWARVLVEFWECGSNIYWFEPKELTVTLSELLTVSGLPVVGSHFEECVLPDEELFRRRPSADGNRRGRLVLQDVYPALLRHYRQLYISSGMSMRARAAMPVDTWVRSFLQDCHLSSIFVSLRDPFDFSLRPGVSLLEDTAEPSSVGYRSPALRDMDEELLLAGFLATWLCTFVLPLKVGSVRCSALLSASQLSQGQRLSLAPVVLARICRIFRMASEASSLELRDPYFLERGYPTILQLVQASSTLESERVRLFFFAPHLVVDHFSVVHQPNIVDLPSYLREQILLDGLDRQGRCTLLQNRSTLRIAEYFASMRPGWLCYLSGSFVTLEGYQPNIVSRQFGFSQATPYDGRPLIPGVADTIHMDTVPLDARLYTASTVWLHLLRFGTGSTFRIAPPHSQTGVSYLHLTWVRLSFALFLERGAQKFEHRVRTLGLPRGQRPSRGTSRTRDDRGRHNDVHTTAEHTTPTSRTRDDRERYDDVHTTVGHTTPSPVRVRDSGSDLHRTEAPRYSRRHSGTRHVEPSSASVDQIASLVREHFLSPNEVPLGPRMLMDISYLSRGPREDIYGLRMSDFTGYSVLDPFTEFSFQVYPYGSFWPGETSEFGSFWPGESSGAGVPSHTEPSDVPSYTPTVLDLVPIPVAPYPGVRPGDPVGYHPETRPSDFDSSSSVPAGADYISEIHHHVPVAPDPWHGDMYGHCTSFLQDLIARVDPRSPDSMGMFTSTANHTLGLLANLGLKASEMQYWETLCREIEFHIRRLQSLSVLRTRVLLPELQEKVDRCRAATTVARDEFDRSTEALRRHREGLSSMANEIEGLTSRVKDLWRDIKGVMSCKSDLQEGHGRRERLIRREQQHNQMLQQSLQAAETALTRALEELHTAETEYQVLAERTPEHNDREKDGIDEDAFEALFSQLEEDLKTDEIFSEDENDEITEDDLVRLEQELDEALCDEEFDEVLPSMSDDMNYSDDDEELQPKLKNWQLRRLAYALKIGRRKASIKNLSAELGLERARVLELLREPPPNLLMMCASLPEEVAKNPEPVCEPLESSFDSDISISKSEPKEVVPVHVMQTRWSMQKRLKKVQLITLERVYARTKRPTNAMISSIVHVTNLPWKRVVKWFEDKRLEDGVPVHREPFLRSSLVKTK